MKTPAIPSNENERLRKLYDYRILDSEAELAFDGLARLAAHIAGTSVALVSLVDSNRQWFKARFGLETHETSRDISFCGHVVASGETLVVSDALQDERFADNPLVKGAPGIRCYAGIPLRSPDDFVIGTLCVIDYEVKHLTSAQLEMLGVLAQQVIDQLELRRIHRATHERELVQAALLESLPGLYFHLARDHTLLDVHGASRQHLFADPSAFLGRRVEEVLSPEASTAICGAIERAQTSGNLQVCQYQLAIGGRLQHFESRIAVAVDGSVVALVNQVTDIKEQNELLESVCRAQSSFLASADPKITFDRLLGDLLTLTQSDYGFIGEVLRAPDGAPYLKTHAITNIAWDDASHSFYEEHAAKGLEFRNLNTLFGAALTSGQPVIANSPTTDPRRGGLPHGHPPLNAFLGVPLHSGDELIGLIGLANRVDGYDDTVVRFLRPLSMTIARMIELIKSTRAKNRSEQRAEEREIHFRTIVDTAIDAIITIDEGGLVHHANPAVERLFGFAPSELVGKSVNVIMPPPVREQHDGYLAEYSKTGVRHVIGIGREITALKKDGTTFPAELAVSEFQFDGKRFFTGVVRDLSDRKRIELLQSEFISTVSHELRTPLTSIRGSLGLVAGGATGELSKEAKEYVDIAVANCERLVRLINDILDIEKVQSGQMEFRYRTMDLGAIVTSVIASNRAYATAQRVHLHATSNWPSGEVLVDPDRLTQVLGNLISNAVKFSPPESDVELHVARIADCLRVSVRDYGPGIAPEFRDRMFTRFAQGDSSTTRKKGGTGLGLAISKAIIEKMNGRIDFEPAEGGGAIFYFELPHFPPPPSAGTPSVGKRRVLVCEDDPGTSRLLETWLALADFEVHVAPTLERARRLLSNQHYDVVTLDIRLADGSGAALAEELNALDHHAPIVVVTAAETSAATLVQTASAIISKPFDRQQLVNAVQLAAESNALPCRVLHVEADEDLRRVLRRTLPRSFSVVEAGDVRTAMSALRGEAFDVIVTDEHLPDGSANQLLDLTGLASLVVFSTMEVGGELAHAAALTLVKSRSQPMDVAQAIMTIMAQKGGAHA